MPSFGQRAAAEPERLARIGATRPAATPESQTARRRRTVEPIRTPTAFGTNQRTERSARP